MARCRAMEIECRVLIHRFLIEENIVLYPIERDSERSRKQESQIIDAQLDFIPLDTLTSSTEFHDDHRRILYRRNHFR